MASQGYVDNLTTMISLSNQAMKKAREAIEADDEDEILVRLVAVGDLLLLAHTEVLAAVRTFRPG